MKIILFALLWSLLSPVIFFWGFGLSGGPLIFWSLVWGIIGGIFFTEFLDRKFNS